MSLLRIFFPATLVFALVLPGCEQSSFEDVRGPGDEGGDDDDGGPDGPGQSAREERDVGCEVPADCGPGETCEAGVCVMQRCQDGPYASAAPLPPNLKFFVDREFVVADAQGSEGRFFVDGYRPNLGAVEYPGSWDMGSTEVVDVAGGDFFGANPELFAVATAGSTRIRVGGIEESIEIDVGFQPHALAAGDTDGDELDEVFVLGRFGNYAVCGIDDGACLTGYFQNGNGIDVTIGDVDGDGQQEVALLLDNGGSEVLYVLELSAGVDDLQGPAGHALAAIEAGDPDGDGIDQIYGLSPAGSFGGAQLHAYTAMGGGVSLLESQTVDDASIDLTFGDLDADEQDELLLLREGREVELLRGTQGANAVVPEFTHLLADSGAPSRIAAVDFDGDSPRSHLIVAEPTLIPGPIVPVALGLFPPYHAEFSDGPSSVTFGREESSAESFSDTVSLDMSLDFGVSAGLFDIAKVGLGTRIRNSVRFTETQTFTQRVGTRYSAAPESYFEGEPYGVVTLTCGCFHAYTYEVDDPAGVLGEGADSERFVLTVPVGGSEMLWSTPRYNAMAEAVGGLPIMEVPYRIGNPGSYPSQVQRLDGSAVPAQDMVFEDVPSLLVGDSGSAGFFLIVGDSTTNSASLSTSISFSANVSSEIPILGGGVKFGAELGVGWGQGYSVKIGDRAIFAGGIPPILDDPDTPDDEYVEYAYATLPFVYRQPYTDANGEPAAYYVISYAVAQD